MSTIIYIEDNASARRIVQRMLEPEGYTVEAFEDGEVGFAYALNRPPELFLLDIQMPAIAGDELCQRIKAHADLSSVPVVALTARVIPGERQRLLDLGFDDYIPKPVTKEKLLTMLERIFGAS